jgi:hypothetical protein
MAQAILTKPGAGRTIAIVGDVYRFLATGGDTNGKYALWEIESGRLECGGEDLCS